MVDRTGQVGKGVYPSGQTDGFGNVVSGTAHVHPIVGGDKEKGHGLSGGLLIQDGSEPLQQPVEIVPSLVLLAQQSSVQLDPAGNWFWDAPPGACPEPPGAFCLPLRADSRARVTAAVRTSAGIFFIFFSF